MIEARRNHPALGSSEIIMLTCDEFIEKYKPIPNHIRPDASCEGWTDNDEDNGVLFETYGEEKAFVFSQPKNLVWSYVDGSNNGCHVTNAFVDWKIPIGYFVCRVPYNIATDIQVEVIPDCVEGCQCERYCSAK
jgi:hypothetical protein